MTMDPRAALEKMEAEETAAIAALEAMQKANADQKAEMLKKVRDEDLAIVRAKCKLHDFTATDLRTYLKVKGAAKKGTPRKSTSRKPAAKKRASKA